MKKLLLGSFLLLFALPALAFDIALPGENNKVNVYASLRGLAVYQNINRDGAVLAGAKGDGDGLVYMLQPDSRLGANLNLGNFYGTVEFGFAGDNSEGFAKGFRLLYAGYKFGNGFSLSFGRQYTLAETMYYYDNIFDDDNGMLGFGTLATSRLTMLKLNFFGVDIAVVANNYLYESAINPFIRPATGSFAITADDSVTRATVSSNVSVANQAMPSFEAAYNLDFGIVTGKIFGSYTGISSKASDMKVTVDGNTALDRANLEAQKEWINSFTAGALVRIQYEKFMALVSGFYAMNGNLTKKVYWGNDATGLPYNSLRFNDISSADYLSGNYNNLYNGYQNNGAFGVAMSVGYDITEKFNVTVGGGYQRIFSNVYTTKNKTGGDVKYYYDSWSAWIATPIKANSYITLYPTVGYYTYMTIGRLKQHPLNATANYIADDTVTGILIAGMQMRINF